MRSFFVNFQIETNDQKHENNMRKHEMNIYMVQSTLKTANEEILSWTSNPIVGPPGLKGNMGLKDWVNKNLYIWN